MSKRLLSGHEVEQVGEEELKDIDYDIFRHGMVRILPEGWLYPSTATTFLDKIYNMEFRPDDILLVTFPKCGTTWMQEIIWAMIHNLKLDDPMTKLDWLFRCPQLCMDMLRDKIPADDHPHLPDQAFKEMYPNRKSEDGLFLLLAEDLPSPRLMKTHYPLTLLPKSILEKVKVVYVARNPKDAAVSGFNFSKMNGRLQSDADKDKFYNSFMKDNFMYSPYWPHVKEAWEKRHHPNLLFVFYEDMKADIMKQLGRVNEFLGTALCQETLEAVRQGNGRTTYRRRYRRRWMSG
ncbi:sulfotransferase 1C4-like isoform X2 [Eriocheir sinensis]|uniref:sulfotransferase 1C4-like isoform X2 n=1 Tax=Eriocheir sinensis TaxID=95602 RepID=UPI0021C816C8|nr:sulfotransferase 1C4-like isoform X2 [Eriocheir sinensis]